MNGVRAAWRWLRQMLPPMIVPGRRRRASDRSETVDESIRRAEDARQQVRAMRAGIAVMAKEIEAIRGTKDTGPWAQ